MEDRITDEPPCPEPWGDRPPWEWPGGFRLDCDSHRGGLLVGLGNTAFGAGLFTLIFGFYGVGVLSLPVAWPLGLVVWALARRDLAKMRRGLMDPGGEEKTDSARMKGLAALLTGFVGATLAVTRWLFLIRPWEE